MLEITFGIIRAGWAETTFQFDERAITIGISYISDPFTDLATAALRLLAGDSPVEVVFTDEEESYQLRFEVRDGSYEAVLRTINGMNEGCLCLILPLATEGKLSDLLLMLRNELSRQKANPAARSFMCDENRASQYRWRFPDDQVAALENAFPAP